MTASKSLLLLSPLFKTIPIPHDNRVWYLQLCNECLKKRAQMLTETMKIIKNATINSQEIMTTKTAATMASKACAIEVKALRKDA